MFTNLVPIVLEVYRNGRLPSHGYTTVDAAMQWYTELERALDYFKMPGILELVKDQSIFGTTGLYKYVMHVHAEDLVQHILNIVREEGMGILLPGLLQHPPVLALKVTLSDSRFIVTKSNIQAHDLQHTVRRIGFCRENFKPFDGRHYDNFYAMLSKIEGGADLRQYPSLLSSALGLLQQKGLRLHVETFDGPSTVLTWLEWA
eukprot:jgi/Chrzof1/8588/Cz03g16160.t1